ncbi:MAG: hypothetical protein JWN64_172 [Parcubacteria group bacterium]|nr:hypothetical protein [Parcubacteria group bacterium]
MDINTVAEQVSNLTTTGISSASLWIGNFLVLLVLTIVMILFSYKGGRGGIISLIVGLYVGYAIYIVFPFTEKIISAGGSTMMKAVISIVLYAAATIAPYLFVQRLVGSGFGVLSVVPRFMLSFLTAAFLLALGYHVFDISNIYTFPAPLDTFFAPQGYFFWWFIAPLIGLFLFIH